jgi:hypothetical protein
LQYRFTLAGDFARRSDLGANSTAMRPTAQHSQAGRPGKLTNGEKEEILT